MKDGKEAIQSIDEKNFWKKKKKKKKSRDKK